MLGGKNAVEKKHLNLPYELDRSGVETCQILVARNLVQFVEDGQEELGTRTELKNLNSFANVEGALEAEIERQAEILDAGGKVTQATMAYDIESRRTRVLRIKEDAHDYRYFDDPDLIPLVIGEEQIEAVRAAMPELPDQKRVRFGEEYGLSEYDARLLTVAGC